MIAVSERGRLQPSATLSRTEKPSPTNSECTVHTVIASDHEKNVPSQIHQWTVAEKRSSPRCSAGFELGRTTPRADLLVLSRTRHSHRALQKCRF